MLRLVQISDGSKRRVARVDEPCLNLLDGVPSIYEFVCECLHSGETLEQSANRRADGVSILYDEVYAGDSPWRLLAPIDVPGAPSRLRVSGTGLTHLGSARERQAMHLGAPSQTEEILTDSMKMFRWGVESGRPADGNIGIAPEWFHKGDGSMVRAAAEPLQMPGHGEDGGEEAEIAGVYIVGDHGEPVRIGMTQGNEFSDHKFEKRNYLNLAGSKLRTCSLGPELVVGADFRDIRGEVSVEREGNRLWWRAIASGESNMCHSLANLEHHHFKFSGHRQPGDVHVHFFGADALSFGDGIELRDGDVTEVRFDGFGRALRNPIRVEPPVAEPLRVKVLR